MPFSSLVTLTFDLWPWHSNLSERGTKHVFLVNLLQIRPAVPEMVHTQTKSTGSRRQKQNLPQFTACGKEWSQEISEKIQPSAKEKGIEAGQLCWLTIPLHRPKLILTKRFYSAPQCSHCKRCTTYGISVRLSVCPSVTRRYCVKTTARSTVQFALSYSKMCLVL